jgi:hypothetical protein
LNGLEPELAPARRLRGAGGTSGGLGEFFGGAALAGMGLYLLFERVQVTTSFWSFTGSAGSSFGITLIPLLVGVAMLFFNGRSVVGWLLSAGGLATIVLGIVANMGIYFQRTSLWSTLVILVSLAGGLGLVARSLREKP